MEVWNEWRQENFKIRPSLSGSDLSGMDLSGIDFLGADLRNARMESVILCRADLSSAFLGGALLSRAVLDDANLEGANLDQANLFGASLQKTHLSEAYLVEADLHKANLKQADLRNGYLMSANLTDAILSYVDFTLANLTDARLERTDLTGADLTASNLSGCVFIKTNLTGTQLLACQIYGASFWDLVIRDTIQSNLIISRPGETTITVDNLEIAQFMYLLLNNEKIRDVIDTLTTKVVLILGRFTDERKQVLEAIKDELRHRNYVPVIFDFDNSASRDITETITTLAHMSRFIIADLTRPKSIPQELQAIVPDLPSVPIQPLIHVSQREYGMFEHFTRFPWVLPIVQYDQLNDLLASLDTKVIAPAEAKAKELQK